MTRAASWLLIDVRRDLEHDIKALADRVRTDREFAVELYGALCNASWRHDDGTNWPGGTWRYVAGAVADLRGCGEDYLDFYCSGGEGEITDRVAAVMDTLAWRGVGHGARLRTVDFRTGTTEVLEASGPSMTHADISDKHAVDQREQFAQPWVRGPPGARRARRGRARGERRVPAGEVDPAAAPVPQPRVRRSPARSAPHSSAR